MVGAGGTRERLLRRQAERCRSRGLHPLLRARAGEAPRRQARPAGPHRVVHGLRQLAHALRSFLGRGALQSGRGPGRRGPAPAGAPRARAVALRVPPRRQRRLVLLAPPAEPQHASEAPLARVLQRGPVPDGLAGGEGLRLRCADRRGPPRRGGGAARALSRGDDGDPPGVLLHPHVGLAVRLPATGRPDALHGRQRVLLAGRLPPDPTGRHRDAPGRVQRTQMGHLSRRVPPGLERRVRGTDAQHRAYPAPSGRSRLRRPGLRSRGRLPAAGRQPRPRAAFVFAGIEDEVIGDFGLSGNGAASEEIDRFDHGFGTPRHALLLASSFGHSAVFGPSNLGVGETPPWRARASTPR